MYELQASDSGCCCCFCLWVFCFIFLMLISFFLSHSRYWGIVSTLLLNAFVEVLDNNNDWYQHCHFQELLTFLIFLHFSFDSWVPHLAWMRIMCGVASSFWILLLMLRLSYDVDRYSGASCLSVCIGLPPCGLHQRKDLLLFTGKLSHCS